MNDRPAIKPLGKIVILMLLIGLLAGIYRLFGAKLFPSSSTPGSTPSNGTSVTTGTSSTNFDPKDVCSSGKKVNILVWAWNAQMGLMNANGAPQSTSQSIMCQNGVNLNIQRQDDADKMKSELASFAQSTESGECKPRKWNALCGDHGRWRRGVFEGLK